MEQGNEAWTCALFDSVVISTLNALRTERSREHHFRTKSWIRAVLGNQAGLDCYYSGELYTNIKGGTADTTLGNDKSSTVHLRKKKELENLQKFYNLQLFSEHYPSEPKIYRTAEIAISRQVDKMPTIVGPLQLDREWTDFSWLCWVEDLGQASHCINGWSVLQRRWMWLKRSSIKQIFGEYNGNGSSHYKGWANVFNTVPQYIIGKTIKLKAS